MYILIYTSGIVINYCGLEYMYSKLNYNNYYTTCTC